MRCPFCEAVVFSSKQAAEAGWEPYFWNGNFCINQAVCPSCTSQHLEYNEDVGDFNTKTVLAVPILEVVFTFPDRREEKWHYLRHPGSKHIAYLLSHRRGATVKEEWYDSPDSLEARRTGGT